MHCPNCKHILIQVTLENITVEHCNYCGSTLFEENEINRITIKDAERLSLMKQSDSISGGEKISPRDGSIMERIQNESIPQHITLLRAKSTGEIFAYPEDLLEFKTAQNAKIDYYKTWRIPMPALQQVLVLSFVMVFTGAAIYMASLLQTPHNQAIQAQELCQGGIEMIDVKDDVLVSCLTSIPLKCTIQATCDGRVIDIETSSAQTTHFGSVSKTCTDVRFVCSDNGKEIDTDWKSLIKKQ